MAKETEIVKLLRYYFSAFPNATMEDGAWAIYARVLTPLTIDEINAAMMKLLLTAKFFPTVSEIYQAAQSIRETAQENSLPTASEAWGEVLKMAFERGLYRKWEYSCPEVEKALHLFGGKECFCNMQESTMGVDRAHFMKIYTEVVEKTKVEKENNVAIDTTNTRAKLAQNKIIQLAEAKRARK